MAGHWNVRSSLKCCATARGRKCFGDTLKSSALFFSLLGQTSECLPLVRTTVVAPNWLLDMVDEFVVTSTAVLHGIEMHADPSFQQVGARDSPSLRNIHYGRMNRSEQQ